ncbi:sulfatase-like hydrolase/transferase [Flexithrix dorotheae]|uniref:sulfatase-like hydrolase/transferase n=1 Tax=Flexithrix dorotheae TaxID=70993 RepID=UPI000370E6F5|nr:sulfatase-like hydrolase/transferase [Flexithrix dorotheae]
MKNWSVHFKLLLLLAVYHLSIFTGFSQDNPPNVIIIYTDDQGSIDVNCYGAKDLHTPNMDKIAQTGVRFTQFYAAAPVCSPSRAALMTGKTPLAAGLPGNASSHKGKEGLPSSQVTIAEKMKENGYVTGHVGKWHLGYTEATMPNGQGFDYSFGHMGGCIDNYSHFFYWNGPNRHDLWENNQEIWRDGEFFQDLMAEKANKFIEENKVTPFFLYYAINLPHYPLQGTNKWRTHYKDLESPRNMYAAAVSTVDERIGVLLKKLEELGIRDNTILIFQSDHGHSMEERTFGAGGSAGIYRGAKFSLFEGGIRVPAMISWPKGLPQNEVRDQMGINTDWFPTILELCGITYNENEFEGKSLVQTLKESKPSPHEKFWWYSNKNIWAVRKGDWKLLKNPRDPSQKTELAEKDSLFLVNIKTHPEELENQVEKHPEKVQELMAEYELWYDRVK